MSSHILEGGLRSLAITAIMGTTDITAAVTEIASFVEECR